MEEASAYFPLIGKNAGQLCPASQHSCATVGMATELEGEGGRTPQVANLHSTSTCSCIALGGEPRICRSGISDADWLIGQPCVDGHFVVLGVPRMARAGG